MATTKHHYKCVLPYCESSSKRNPHIKFTCWPSYGSKRFNEWCQITGLTLDAGRHFICHKHFKQCDFVTTRLSRKAFPSLFITDNLETIDSPLQVNKSGHRTYGKDGQIETSTLQTEPENFANCNMSVDYSVLKTPEQTKIALAEKIYSPLLGEKICTSCMRKDKMMNFWRKKYLKLLRIRMKTRLVTQRSKYLAKVYSKKADIIQHVDSLKHVSTRAKTFCRMLLRKKHKVSWWPRKERLLAHSLYYKSSKLYKYMRSLKFNLPCPDTLNAYLSIKSISPGIYTVLLEKLNPIFKNSDDLFKQAVLVFDEIHIRSDLQYNMKQDLIEGVCDDGLIRKPKFGTEICTFLIRGSKWSYVIGHIISAASVSGEELKNFILRILCECKKNDIHVVATVCDQGSNNRNCYKSLGVTKENPMFRNDSASIIALYDYIHLEKSVRNTMIKFDLDTSDGIVSWDVIKALYEADANKITKMCPKLKKEYINPNNFQRMKAKPAIQTLSWSVASAIRVLNELSRFSINVAHKAESTATFIEKFNNLFDVFNTKFVSFYSPYKKPLSVDNKFATEFLREMKSYVKNINLIQTGRKSKVYVFDGIIQNINGILLLIEQIKNIPHASYILTAKLQQDIVENLFSILRSKGGFNRYPSAAEYSNHIRHLLSNNTVLAEMISEGSNCIPDATFSDEANTNNCRDHNEPVIESRNTNSTYICEDENDITNDCEEFPQEIEKHPSFYNIDLTEQNSAKYFSGYVAFRMAEKLSCDECRCKMIHDTREIEMPSDYLILFKNFNNAKRGLLKSPTDIFFKISMLHITCFHTYFKSNFHQKYLKRRISEQCVNLTNQHFYEWFNDDKCGEHKLKILDFTLLVLIRKHCQWLCEKQKKSNFSHNRVQVLTQ